MAGWFVSEDGGAGGSSKRLVQLCGCVSWGDFRRNQHSVVPVWGPTLHVTARPYVQKLPKSWTGLGTQFGGTGGEQKGLPGCPHPPTGAGLRKEACLRLHSPVCEARECRIPRALPPLPDTHPSAARRATNTHCSRTCRAQDRPPPPQLRLPQGSESQHWF